jgi:hypothetical protein
MEDDMLTIANLKKICSQLDEKEPDMNKNFWAVNMHGDETLQEFVVPKGVRIIMFCYSGRKLHVCPRFDKFNWREIFLNEEASFNYCTFISNLSRYSSLRDHFCVYSEGNVIRDLVFRPDENFRDGIFKLPVRAAVFDPENKQVYVSDPEIFSQTVEKTEKVSRVSVNKQAVAKIVKDKDSSAIIFTPHIITPEIKLSQLVTKLRVSLGKIDNQFTLLLLTCRTGEPRRGLLHPLTVYEELENLVRNYAGQEQAQERMQE